MMSEDKGRGGQKHPKFPSCGERVITHEFPKSCGRHIWKPPSLLQLWVVVVVAVALFCNLAFLPLLRLLHTAWFARRRPAVSFRILTAENA